MDSDLWTFRIAAAKQRFSLQRHQNFHIGHLNIEDFELEDEEGRTDFTCPYCHEDYDIASLCSHLEDEHSFESKVVVCPICSHRVLRDLVDHVTLQHGHLFKLHRRQRLQRVIPSSHQALSLLGRDLRQAHLQELLGGLGYRSSSHVSYGVGESFQSSLSLSCPVFDAEEISNATFLNSGNPSAKSGTNDHIWKTCVDSSLPDEARAEKKEEATVRALFMQDLLLSTLFID